HEGVPVPRRAPAADRRTAAPGVPAPATAPEDPVRAPRRADRIRRLTRIVLPIPVRAPLPHVSSHVPQAPPVLMTLSWCDPRRLARALRQCVRAILVLKGFTEPGVLPQFVHVISKPIGRLCSRPARGFPLGLRGQPVPGPQPATEHD